MKTEQEKAYREPELLRDILKRILEDKKFIRGGHLKLSKAAAANEQSDKEVILCALMILTLEIY